MALVNKKLSAYDDLASANIDETTKIVVLTGATKTNKNLPIKNLIEDSLTSDSVVKPLSAAQGKILEETKATKESPTFTGTVALPSTTSIGDVSSTELGYLNGVTANVQSQMNLKAPKAYPEFTGSLFLTSNVSLGGENGDMTFKITDTYHGDAISVNDYGYFSIWNKSFFDVAPILNNLETFEDNTAAAALATGTVYKTSTGVLMVKY